MSEIVWPSEVETLDAPNWFLMQGYETCPRCGGATVLENNGEIHCTECDWVLE